MTRLLERIESAGIDRRRFVGLAAGVGLAGSLGLTGCENKMKPADEESPKAGRLENGEWVPYDCIAGTCAYRCFNRAYVVDGIIVRSGTDTRPDSVDNPQLRSCIKGKSARKIVTAAERLKYPMKRKSWQPGGKDFHPELRGNDSWERVSWDEAISLIADELTRIKETYGNRSFLAFAQADKYLAPGLFGSAILNALGGCLTTWGQASQGGLPVVCRHMRGAWALGMMEASDRMALRHTKLFVLWGVNPTWSHSAGDMYHFLNTKKASGAKVVFIDPFLNPSMQALADLWVPVRPGTDGALLEALAYEMISNNLHDQAFLDAHCIGFDADHMPPNASPNENFKDHILGLYDGVPKTPEWASDICGTPVQVIRDLAQELATTKPVSWKSSGAPARTYYGNRYAQLFLTVGFMIGSVGTLGGDISAGAGVSNCLMGTPGGANLVSFGGSGYQYVTNAICTETRAGSQIQNGLYDPEQEYGIPFAETFKAIVEGRYHTPGPTGATRACDIRCIVRDNAHQPSNQQSGGFWVEKAYRKDTLEFVLVQDYFHTVDAQYADIVLPVCTTMEADLSISGSSVCPSDFAMCGRKVIEPYFESKFDVEIYFLLCDRLGIAPDVAPRISIKQAGFNKIASGTIVKDSPAEREPLAAITEADLEALGVEGSPQEGRVPIRELIEQGSYRFERKADDAYMNIYDKGFVADPEANPLKTATGKYEIYSQALKDYYDRACFNDIDPLPKYKASKGGYESIKEAPEYRFQMVSIHHIRQAHTNYSNVKQLNEVFSNDLVMSAFDARKEGLKKGDWVIASSVEGGKVLRRLNVIPNLIPGVVLLGQGNWRAINQQTGLDEGGNTNTITPGNLLGDGYQSFNTVLLKIQKYTGTEPLPDYRRPPLVPLAE